MRFRAPMSSELVTLEHDISATSSLPTKSSLRIR